MNQKQKQVATKFINDWISKNPSIKKKFEVVDISQYDEDGRLVYTVFTPNDLPKTVYDKYEKYLYDSLKLFGLPPDRVELVKDGLNENDVHNAIRAYLQYFENQGASLDDDDFKYTIDSDGKLKTVNIYLYPKLDEIINNNNEKWYGINTNPLDMKMNMDLELGLGKFILRGLDINIHVPDLLTQLKPYESKLNQIYDYLDDEEKKLLRPNSLRYILPKNNDIAIITIAGDFKGQNYEVEKLKSKIERIAEKLTGIHSQFDSEPKIGGVYYR